MSICTLAISCLTTSNLPWFMDLTFQVPMQYCSLEHQTLLLSPVPSTTGCCFCSCSVSSFFLELLLYSPPGAYWAPTDLGSSSFSVIPFCLFMLFMGISIQEYWSGLPFRNDVNYTVEVTNRSKGLDLIEHLKYYGQRFMTLYKRQWSRPSPRKRNAKGENGCLRRPYK